MLTSKKMYINYYCSLKWNEYGAKMIHTVSEIWCCETGCQDGSFLLHSFSYTQTLPEYQCLNALLRLIIQCHKSVLF